MRRLWPNPDEDTEPGGILSVIAEDIDIFEVSYFDGEEWEDEWPEDMGSVPELVEVTIAAEPTSRGGIVMESFVVNFTSSAESQATALEGGDGEQGISGQEGGNVGGGTGER